MSKFLTGPNIIAGAGLTGAIVYFATRENMSAAAFCHQCMSKLC